MKTIMYPDYWVEVPAGEYLTGISETQANLIRDYLYTKINYDQLPLEECQIVNEIIAKDRHSTNLFYSGQIDQLTDTIESTAIEQTLEETEPYSTIIQVESMLATQLARQRPVWVERFYIARFPFTRITPQSEGFIASQMPGPLEDQFNDVTTVLPKQALWLCQELGVRLPTEHEWNKAARGAAGYLYPWGDEWRPDAGFFYSGQPNSRGRKVDAYPEGVSPYGVWSMAGGLPELIISFGFGNIPRVYLKGCHTRESSVETAWLDHMLINDKGGNWLSLRPVMSQWPQQQWSGFWTSPKTEKEKPEISGLPSSLPVINLAVLTADNASHLKPLAWLQARDPLWADMVQRLETIIWSPNRDAILIDSHPKLWVYNSSNIPSSPIIVAKRGGYCAITPNQQRLALMHGVKRLVRVWDLVTQTDIFSEQVLGSPSTAVFSPDGRLLAAADSNWHMYVWNIEQGARQTIIKGPTNVANKLCFSPDGRRLISASADGRIWIWEIETGDLVCTLVGHTAPVHCFEFMVDNSLLASAGGDGTVRLWDITTGEACQVLRDPNGNAIASLSFSPNGRLLATGQSNGTFTIWNLKTSEIAAIIPCYGKWIDDHWIVQVAFNPDGTLLATYNRGAVIWGIAPDGY